MKIHKVVAWAILAATALGGLYFFYLVEGAKGILSLVGLVAVAWAAFVILFEI